MTIDNQVGDTTKIEIQDKNNNTFVHMLVRMDSSGYPCEVTVNGHIFYPNDVVLQEVPHLGHTSLEYSTSPDQIRDRI